jgi:hypothetical protein
MQVAGINLTSPDNWEDGELKLDSIWGYQFKDDGILLRGVSGGYNDWENQSGPYYNLGQQWSYEVVDDKVILRYITSSLERVRTWQVISVDSTGRALVLESSTYDRDTDGNGEISDDERGNLFIQPRFNVLYNYDLSQQEAAWNALATSDFDGDGINDKYEIDNGLNVHDASDAALDGDNDGLTNLEEFNLGTNPNNADSDGDGLSDIQERDLGTDPNNTDSDGDGYSDGEEVAQGSDPSDDLQYL